MSGHCDACGNTQCICKEVMAERAYLQPHTVIDLYEQAMTKMTAELEAALTVADDNIGLAMRMEQERDALAERVTVAERDFELEAMMLAEVVSDREALAERVRVLTETLSAFIEGGLEWDDEQGSCAAGCSGNYLRGGKHDSDCPRIIGAQLLAADPVQTAGEGRNSPALLAAARELDACLDRPDPNDPTKLLVGKGKGERFVQAAKRLRAALEATAAPARPDLERAVVDAALNYGHMLLSEEEPTGKSLKARLEARKHLMAVSCDLVLGECRHRESGR